jgi:hypothetical protein
MQADTAAINRNVVAEGHMLVVMLALTGSDMDTCKIPTVKAM